MTTATETTTKRKSNRKPVPRSLVVVEPISEANGGYGAIRLTVGKVTNLYLVHQIPADFGESAWEVEKLADDFETVETYHVLLTDNPKHSTCDCRGCEAHAHCKHRDALLTLAERGQLPRLLRKANVSGCDRCHRVTSEPLCAECEAEDAYWTACDQAAQMEAAGLDPWAAPEADDVYETAIAS